MKNWFLQKNDREQKIIVGLAIFSLLLLLYAFLYLPLTRNNAQLQSNINDIQAEITQMQGFETLLARFPNNTGNTVAMDTTQLMVLIEQIAQQQQIKLSDIKKQDENKVAVILNKVAFNAVMRWLDLLKNQYHINIANLVVESEKKGLVNITVVITP